MPTWQETFQHLVDVATRATIVDPDLSSEYMESAGAPEISEATKDANRYTMYVPYDHTTLSLGNKSTGWINDVGITGRTDNHMHFFVRGVNDVTDNTVVSLGSPATSVSIDEFEAGTVSEMAHGYTMITTGDAWHESQGKHYIVSRAGEVTLRTAGPEMGALVQSDTGTVSVLAGGGITIGTSGDITIGAWPQATIPDSRFSSMWQLDKTDGWATAKFYASKTATYIGLTVVTAVAAKGLVTFFAPAAPEPIPGVSVWAPSPWFGRLAWAKDALLTAATIGQALIDWEGTAGSGRLGLAKGNVSVQSEKYSGMYSGVASTIYGHVGTYLFSSGTSDMIGVISTSMSGVGWASVWGGISASIGALGNTSVVAEYGGAEIRGKKGVTVDATVGGAAVRGNAFAQMSSVIGPASVHGATRAYVAAGFPTGFGMVVSPGNMWMGQVPATVPFTAARANPMNSIVIQPMLMMATIGTSKLTLSSTMADLKGGIINVTATGVATVKGSMVLLG
jgi:hypothetical protein